MMDFTIKQLISIGILAGLIEVLVGAIELDVKTLGFGAILVLIFGFIKILLYGNK